MKLLLCPYHLEGCSMRFRSQWGRTNHVRSSIHRNNNAILHNQSENGQVTHDDNHEPPVDEDEYFMNAEHDDVPRSAPASPTQLEAANLKVHVHPPARQRNIHPQINGIFFLSLFLSLS
jgi:hypothetical protein